VAVKNLETVGDNTESTQERVNTDAAGYYSLTAHVLLLFTFGIWNLIWIYKTTGFLNCVEGEEERNPTTKLLLCMFIPFYSIYWVYKSSQRIEKLSASKGVHSDIATPCLILEFFIPLIPPIIMQDKINAAVRAVPPITQNTGSNNPEAHAAQSVNVQSGVPEELKKYKDLLDSGIITQEEFEAKKKQLLDL
jgi:hypothetical protein